MELTLKGDTNSHEDAATFHEVFSLLAKRTATVAVSLPAHSFGSAGASEKTPAYFNELVSNHPIVQATKNVFLQDLVVKSAQTTVSQPTTFSQAEIAEAVQALAAETEANKKRTRRTRAQIEADEAAAKASVATEQKPAETSSSPEFTGEDLMRMMSHDEPRETVLETVETTVQKEIDHLLLAEEPVTDGYDGYTRDQLWDELKNTWNKKLSTPDGASFMRETLMKHQAPSMSQLDEKQMRAALRDLRAREKKMSLEG